MLIEVQGPEAFLEEFRLYLDDQLEKNGFLRGPKLGFSETGSIETYTLNEVIITLHLKEGIEGGNYSLSLESEKKVPNIEGIWDNALIEYCKVVIARIKQLAQNPELIEKELKKS